MAFRRSAGYLDDYDLLYDEGERYGLGSQAGGLRHGGVRYHYNVDGGTLLQTPYRVAIHETAIQLYDYGARS